MTAQTRAVLKTYFETGDKPTQQQFTDLIDTFLTEASSGTSQMPDQTIQSNIAGVSANAANNTLSAIIDAVINNSQGSILYRGASLWSSLPAGTAGQLLSTNGSAAAPSWSTASGTGTVTSVSAGGGLTASVNPITAAGDLSLAQVPSNRILANATGVSAAPTSTQLTTLIDSIGSAQGTILYRGAASWSALAPGTSGQFLKTNGAAANPAWAAATSTWTTVNKTSDQTVSSNAVFFSDNELLFAAAANTKYAFRLKIFFSTVATADFKWGVIGPAAPTLVNIMGADIAPGGTTWNLAQIDTAFGVSHPVLSTVTGAGYIEINGIVQVAAASGSVIFRWAQNASVASNTTVYAGSQLEYATVV